MNRERQARWDLANLRSAGTKLLPREYDLLRYACAVEGISVYSLIRRLLLAWLVEFAQENPSAAEVIVLRVR